MSNLKWLLLIICGVLLLAQNGQAQNLAPNPGIETPYGGTDPNFVADGWHYSNINPAGSVAVSRLAGGGIDSSYSLHLTATGAAGENSAGNGAWASIPVVAGRKYQIRGQWRGSMKVDTTINTSRAGLEYYVGFTNTPNARATGSEAIIYKKRIEWSTTTNSYTTSTTYNIDTATGTWDWQDISLSPIPGYTSQSIVPWTGDTVTATPPSGGTTEPLYMTIRVQLFTNYQQTSPLPYVDLDNVVVTACQGLPSADLNGDCVVNMKDLAVITGNWLQCGLNYSSMCW